MYSGIDCTPKEFVSRLNKFAHARTVEPIPIDLINQPEKWRRILEANVDIFAESMRQNGQLQPIGLVPAKEVGRYDIKWGEQRLLGAKKLNWTHIDAVVLRDVSKAEADLMTLDENIARNGYSCVLEEACARTQQKALYLQLHPETGRGGDRRSNRASNPNNSVLVEPFTAYVANETNQSSDRVEQLVRIGTSLGPYADTLYGTPIADSFTELLALSRCSKDELPRLVEHICSGRASKVSDAKNVTVTTGTFTRSDERRKLGKGASNTRQSEIVPSEGDEIQPQRNPNSYNQYVALAREKLVELEDAAKMDPQMLAEYLTAVLPVRNPNLWQRFVSAVYDP